MLNSVLSFSRGMIFCVRVESAIPAAPTWEFGHPSGFQEYPAAQNGMFCPHRGSRSNRLNPDFWERRRNRHRRGRRIHQKRSAGHYQQHQFLPVIFPQGLWNVEKILVNKFFRIFYKIILWKTVGYPQIVLWRKSSCGSKPFPTFPHIFSLLLILLPLSIKKYIYLFIFTKRSFYHAFYL